MQEQQWCTGCFSLVSTSILYEKHSISCPFKENIKYSNVSNPNAVNKLPVLDRYPNNEELYKMVVALTDNLNKANKTINALKRKINLRSNKIEIVDYLNENILPSVTIDQILSQPLQIYDEEISSEYSSSDSDSDIKKNDHNVDLSIDTFYEIGFYTFVLQCLSASLHKQKYNDDVEQSVDAEHVDEIEDITKEMKNVDIDNSDNSDNNSDNSDNSDNNSDINSDNNSDNSDNSDNESSYKSTPNTKRTIPPILSFKQKKDTVYIFENNCWNQNTVSELTVNNFFNRFARLVHSKIMKIFAAFKNRHETELYVAEFQSVLSKQLKCICSIDMDHNNIVSKIIKPWHNLHKLDLYDFMNCNKT